MILVRIYEGTSVFPRNRAHISYLGRCGHIPTHLSLLRLVQCFFLGFACYSPIIDVNVSRTTLPHTACTMGCVVARPSLHGVQICLWTTPITSHLCKGRWNLYPSLFLKISARFCACKVDTSFSIGIFNSFSRLLFRHSCCTFGLVLAHS